MSRKKPTLFYCRKVHIDTILYKLCTIINNNKKRREKKNTPKYLSNTLFMIQKIECDYIL